MVELSCTVAWILDGVLFEKPATVELAVEKDGEDDLDGFAGAIFGDGVEGPGRRGGGQGQGGCIMTVRICTVGG